MTLRLPESGSAPRPTPQATVTSTIDFLRRRLADAIRRDDVATIVRLTSELNFALNGE